MKFKWFLISEAVVCFLLGMSGMNLASGLITFPFAPIAQALRMMSLSGGFGNTAAIAVYCLIGIIPWVILALALRKREFSPEDLLLPVLSLLLFGGLYLMINPGLMSQLFPAFGDIVVWQGTICVMIWCVVIAYGVFRLIRRTQDASMEALLTVLEYGLRIVAGVVVFQIFAVQTAALLVSIQNAAASNYATYSMDQIIIRVLIFAVRILPSVLELGVIFAGLHLLDCMKKDYYSLDTLAATDTLSKGCIRMLTVTVICNLTYNFMHLFFSGILLNVDLSVNLPLDLILFALCALLLARFIRRNHALKAENDSFI